MAAGLCRADAFKTAMTWGLHHTKRVAIWLMGLTPEIPTGALHW